MGIWYAFKGELPLFLMSCLVALQHECAHAFSASRLGYSLRAVVLMPFGAVIDGDMRGVRAKDEIAVALAGPLCNLMTAVFFMALWWFAPTMYAFTDTAFTSSMSIALVNLLPAYPLDGGRVCKAILIRNRLKKGVTPLQAEEYAGKLCRLITFAFALLSVGLFVSTWVSGRANVSLFVFAIFLIFGAVGNVSKNAVYDRMDYSSVDALRRGVEIRRVAVLSSCPIKNALRYVSRETYLVIEVYDEAERRLFTLTQNELAELFLSAPTPYTSLAELKNGAFLHEKV